MIRPNLRRFLTAAITLLAVPSVTNAQHYAGGAGYPAVCPPPHAGYAAPTVDHYVSGSSDVWDESRPIERFLTNAVEQSWIRMEFLYMDFGDLGDGFVGASVSGLQSGPLSNQREGRDVPVDYSDNLNGGTPVGATLIPTYNGLDLDNIPGVRGTWGLKLDGAEMELSFFGTAQQNAVSDFGSLAEGRIARYALDNTIDPELGLSQTPLLPGKKPFAPNYAIPLSTNGVEQDFLGANALVFNDTLTLGMSSQVWGSELAFLTPRRAPGGAGPSWQWLGGVRYLSLDEKFSIRGTNGTFNGTDAIVPDRFTAIDSTTVNNIYGPEIGARLALNSQYFSLSATPRVMMGLNDYTATVASDITGGLPTSGERQSIDFATATQLNLLTEVHLNDHFSLYGGYDFLCITSITRPQDNVLYDSTVPALGGAATADIRERTTLNDFFYAHGFSFGATFRY